MACGDRDKSRIWKSGKKAYVYVCVHVWLKVSKTIVYGFYEMNKEKQKEVIVIGTKWMFFFS